MLMGGSWGASAASATQVATRRAVRGGRRPFTMSLLALVPTGPTLGVHDRELPNGIATDAYLIQAQVTEEPEQMCIDVYASVDADRHGCVSLYV